MKKRIVSVMAFLVIHFFLFAQTDDHFIWVIEPKFEVAEAFIEDLSRIKLNGKWGFVNKNGETVVSPLYDSVANFSDGLAAFLWQNGKWGFVDKTGKNVIYPQFDYVGAFSEGSAAALKGNAWGMIDKKGNFIGEPMIDNSGDLQTMLAVSQVEKPQAKMSASLADKFDLDYVGRYFYSLAAASKDGGWGFVDQNGTVVIDLKYEEVGDFSNQVARVMLHKQWGYIDMEGNLIIPAQFDKANDFNDEIAFVLVDQKWGLIRKTIATEDDAKNKTNKTNKKEK